MYSVDRSIDRVKITIDKNIWVEQSTTIVMTLEEDDGRKEADARAARVWQNSLLKKNRAGARKRTREPLRIENKIKTYSIRSLLNYLIIFYLFASPEVLGHRV